MNTFKVKSFVFATSVIISIAISTCLLAQNYEQIELARFYVTDAKYNGTDITEAALTGGGYTVFYMVNNTVYMANCFPNRNTQSFGRIYNVQHTKSPETATDYETDVFKFVWSYSNTYDSKSGTCQCMLIKLYKPQGVVSILRMITEDLDVIEYTGYMNDTLNMSL